MARNRIGKRKYRATFLEHNGKQTETGFPDYTDPANWAPIVANWPCALTASGSAEATRGGQVTSETTHVLFGEWFGGEGIQSVHRCRIIVNDILKEFSVSAPPLDLDGMNMEMKVELKQESN